MTIILFPDSLPKRNINISSFLRARCHFLCFLFARGWCWVEGCRRLPAHQVSGQTGSSRAGNKTSQRHWFNAVCMAFPLQFAITLTSKKSFTSSYLQSFVQKSIFSVFPSDTLTNSLTTTGKGEGGILLF